MELERYEQPLLPAEERRLAELEQVIHDNFLGFVSVGQALAEINESRLYRIDTTGASRTFEDYCKYIWDMNVRRAYQLIDSANVVKQIVEYQNVNHGTQNDTQVPEIIVPQNERQARELARLDPIDQRTVWLGLVMAARDQGGDRPARITAGAVKKAVKAFKGEQFEKAVNVATREASENRSDFVSEEFKLTFSAFLAQVDIERRRNWRETSRKAAFKHLMVLTKLVAEAGPDLEEVSCAMELEEREKLKKAGFRIFRMNARSGVIEEWQRHNIWTAHSTHESPAAMATAFRELLLDHSHVRA